MRNLCKMCREKQNLPTSVAVVEVTCEVMRCRVVMVLSAQILNVMLRLVLLVGVTEN